MAARRAFLWCLITIPCQAFVVPSKQCKIKATPLLMSDETTFQESLSTRWNILQECIRNGDNFKQTLADVIAGPYDQAVVRKEVESLSQSAPCVMFVWESSPSCKKAVQALDKMGVEYKTVRLDQPWSTGNVLRAELGRFIGRTSVPAVFIDGVYVGGYDGGTSDKAPGLVDLAFQGTLRDKLQSVGALK